MAVVEAVEAVVTAEAGEAVVVDHDALAAAGAAVAAVTEEEAAVVVMVAAEVTPVAVAACLAKAIPRAAVTNKLLRCSTAYEN